MAPLDGGSHEIVEKFLDFLTSAVKLRGNYDVLQAYINVFLKVGFDLDAFSHLMYDSLHLGIASRDPDLIYLQWNNLFIVTSEIQEFKDRLSSK